MRVCLVVHHAEHIGGAEKLLLHLLQANRSNPVVDYSVVFLRPGPLTNEVRELGYPVSVLDVREYFEDVTPRELAGTVARLLSHILRTHSEIVMAWQGGSHLFASLAAVLARRPEVWWQQQIPLGWRSERILTLLPTNCVICVSEAVAAAQRRLRPVRGTAIIHPVVDLQRLRARDFPGPAKARQILGLPDGLIVGMATRIAPVKGIDIFLQAAGLVAMRGVEATYVVVGGSPNNPSYVTELKDVAAQAQLGDRVKFIGRVDSPEAELWIQAMDVVVHATVEPEGFGMIIVEAMALGKAVLAASTGGPQEIITNEEDGLLIAPRDPQLMAASLVRLLSQPELRRRLGAGGQRRAQAFGRDRFATAVGSTLRRVAEAAGT